MVDEFGEHEPEIRAEPVHEGMDRDSLVEARRLSDAQLKHLGDAYAAQSEILMEERSKIKELKEIVSDLSATCENLQGQVEAFQHFALEERARVENASRPPVDEGRKHKSFGPLGF